MAVPPPGTPGPAPSAPGAADPHPAAAAPAAPPEAAGAPQPLLQSLASLWRELPGLVSDRVELFSLELQRAGIALVQIVVLIVATAILGVTAWLVLWAGIVAALLAAGLHLAWALLAMLLINLVAIWLAVRRARTLLPRLKLAATRRHLMPSPSTAPTKPSEPTPPPAAPIPPSPPAGQSGGPPSADRPSSHERTDIPPAGQPAAR